MVTNNTAKLALGEGCYNFLLNPQGRIQGDLTAFRVADAGGDTTYLLETDAEQAQPVFDWLDRYIIMDDVALAMDEDSAALVLAGTTAPAILARPAEDQHRGSQAITATEIAGTHLQLCQDGSMRLPVFWLWMAKEAVEKVAASLQEAGAKPGGWQAHEWLRIASGVPQFGQDILARDLPQETGQTRALHFQKGCYLGQEIVERIHSRGNVHRALSGFSLTAAAPAPLPVLDGEQEIGQLTSIATVPLPSGEQTIAMGIVRSAALVAARPLTAGGHPVRPHPLPFL